jgi:myo-inositol catabolism protein IolS
MKYRTLGSTGWEVSAVSMGCWGLSGNWGEISESQAAETIRVARSLGVNLFDTADAYGYGQSERFVGKALNRRPDDVYIATKIGHWGRGADDPPGLKSKWSIIAYCDASLYRLGLDTIDLYQCHLDKPEHPEAFVEAFEHLKQAGKIRHYGISTNDIGALKALNAAGGCATCQIKYSILARAAEKDILPYCLENNIGVLLRGPLDRGLLTGKFSEATRFDDQVRTQWNPDGKQRKTFLENLKTVEKLRTLVPEGRSLVDLAIGFTLANPAVTCPIPGMKTPEQARSNAAAADIELDAATLSRIDELVPPAREGATY